MNKKVIVFGGSGFLGSYIVSNLIERGYDVTIFDRIKPHQDFNNKVKFVEGDILNRNQVCNAIENQNIVYNLIAIAGISDCINNPIEAVQINILGNTIILDACIKYKVDRLIFSSSLYAYSTSGGMYASTKRASEDLIKNYAKYYDLDYTILQYGTLYGIGAFEDNSIYRYIKSALDNNKIEYVGSGDEMREYIHITDAAKLGVDVLDDKYKNKTIIITGHHPIKTKDLFTLIREMLGESIEIVYQSEMPAWKKDSHYKVTPYTYARDLPQKLTSDCYVELGIGILQILENINK